MIADLLLKNIRLVNVLSGEIEWTHLAIKDDLVWGFGSHHPVRDGTYPARKQIDLKGLYVAPGLIDGHLHIESSLLTPTEFARTVLPLGTTTVICDPHEIANVMGLRGIRYILDANCSVPLSIYVMIPSCVPATHLETSGARLEAKDLKSLLNHPMVLGLAEVMNYPAVLFGDKVMSAKLALAQGKVIDGHAPGLTGQALHTYIRAGIRSDHESTRLSEAREKLAAGMYVMIREGTAARNLKDLLPLVTPTNSRRCFFVTDDRHPPDLIKEGHINAIVRKAIKSGLHPVIAIQMATLNTAEYFGLNHSRYSSGLRFAPLGALAPGYQADLIAFDNFQRFNIRLVIKQGKVVARNGKIKSPRLFGGSPMRQQYYQNTMHLAPLKPDALRVKAAENYIKVIGLIPGQIITRKIVQKAKIINGAVVSDIGNDILKIAVIERHHRTGNIGLGFVKGFGLKKGAIGSSVAHDSHNIIVVGTNDNDMKLAAETIARHGGGYVVVTNGIVKASLALPLAGLMSPRPVREVAHEIEVLNHAARTLGCRLPDPFMTLSFLALAPIPELKITDKGLIDVNQFKTVSLFTDKP